MIVILLSSFVYSGFVGFNIEVVCFCRLIFRVCRFFFCFGFVVEIVELCLEERDRYKLIFRGVFFLGMGLKF